MSFNEALDKLKDQFKGLDPAKIRQGFEAFVDGKLDVAKEFWGEQYDAMAASLNGKEEGGGEVSTKEGGEKSPEKNEVPYDQALEIYYKNIRGMAGPLISRLQSNDHWVWAIGLAFPSQTARFSLTALNVGKNISLPLIKILTFGTRQAVKHPFLTSTLVASYFIHKAATEKEYMLPASIGGLKTKIKEERREIAEFARAECDGWETNLTDAQIDQVADVVSGEKSITDVYGITSAQVEEMAVNAISEGFRVDDIEKLEDRTKDGLEEFESTLHSFRQGEKYTSFIQYLNNLRDNVSITFTNTQLEALKTEASKYGIHIWTEETNDGYIWWRRSDHPEEIYSCGIDPNQTAEDQLEAATRFDPNPSSAVSNFNRAFAATLDELRGGIADITENILKGDWQVILAGSGPMLWDGVQERFIRLPINLATRIFKALNGERFQAKEFLMDCAGGTVSVTVLGVAAAVPKFMASKLFGKAFGMSGWKILAESPFLAVTGPLKLGVSFGKRIVVPFGKGVLQGRGNPLSGFAEIYRKNMSDLISTIRRMRYDRADLTRLPDNLRVAFEKIIAYEDSMSELSKLRSRSFKNMKDIREILRKAREILTVDGNIPADEALKLIPEYTSDLTSKLPKVFKGEIIENLSKEIAKIERGLSVPAGISSADISRIMTVMNEAEEAARAKGAAADIARGLDAAAPEARATARTAKRAAAAAEAAAMSTRRAVISGDLTEMMRAGAAVRRADDLARAVREAAAATDNAPVKIAAGNVATATERTVELAREALQTARSPVSGAAAEARRLSDLAIAAFSPARDAANIVIHEADAAARAATVPSFMEGVNRTSTMLDEIAEGDRAASWVQETLQSRKGTELFAESVAPVTHAAEGLEGVSSSARLDMTLSETLEVIKKGQELEPEHLARIRLAVRDGATAEQIAAALRAQGVSPAAAEAGLQALRQERHIGKLMQLLDNLRILRFGGALRGLGNVALRCLTFRKVAQAAPPIVGVAVNVYLANAAWEMAKEFKENPKLADLYRYKAKMFATAGFADLAIEGLIIAGRVGIKGNLALTAGIMALQYMVEGAIDAHAETLMGSNDYIRIGRENGIEELIHRWYTTGEDTNAGEEYDSVFTLGNRGQEYYGFHRSFTREKIIDALLALTSQGMSEENILYRKNYIASQAYQLNVFNFQQGQQLLANSMAFASIMEDRNTELAIQDPSETINLNDQRFDNQRISTEDINRIYKAGRNQLNNGIKVFLREAIEGNDADAEQLSSRLRNLDRNYLSHSINVIFGYLSSKAKEEREPTEVEMMWLKLGTLLITYLQYEGVSFAINPAVSVEANSMADMHQAYFNTRLNPLEVEALKGDFARPSAAVAALYEVAQFYGYQGRPHEEDLKKFFDESHEGMYGIYWKGNEWRTNELGRTTADRRHESTIDEAVIAIINRFKVHPDRILESRHDYLTDELMGEARDDEVRRHEQIKFLATRMNDIYVGYEAPDLEYQRAYLRIPEEQRLQLHELMGDQPEEHEAYSMRRIVILYQKSLREPFNPKMETRSFRLWAQTQSPKRTSVLGYFHQRKNNFNMAGIEDRRMLSQLNTDLNSFNEVFSDLETLGADSNDIDHIRQLYTESVTSTSRVVDRIDGQQTHPINNPTWVQWSEISGAIAQLRVLMSEYESLLSSLGVMDYWKDNGERDRARERQRRENAIHLEIQERLDQRDRIARGAEKIPEDAPEVVRAKANIDFEINEMMLFVNHSNQRNPEMESAYLNAFEQIRMKVLDQHSLADCSRVFSEEIARMYNDLSRGFVGTEVLDVRGMWMSDRRGEAYFYEMMNYLGWVSNHTDIIVAREGAPASVDIAESLTAPEVPSDELGRAKINLQKEIEGLMNELNKTSQSDESIEGQYRNILETILKNINQQTSIEGCVNIVKAGLKNFVEEFITPNEQKINVVWGERYNLVLFRKAQYIFRQANTIALRVPPESENFIRPAPASTPSTTPNSSPGPGSTRTRERKAA
jgi:hypothetical protein